MESWSNHPNLPPSSLVRRQIALRGKGEKTERETQMGNLVQVVGSQPRKAEGLPYPLLISNITPCDQEGLPCVSTPPDPLLCRLGYDLNY